MGNNGKKVAVIDDTERADAVKAIEGDLPYEKTLYVTETKFYLSRTIEDILMAGKLLLVIKEKEGRGEFVKICEEDIGIPHSSAYNFMNVAIKAGKYATIDFSKFGKKTHLYSLLNAPEEDLKDLEENGVLAGHTIDELEVMSVKEMRALIRQLRDKGEKIIGKQVSKLVAKNTDLQKEVSQLKARLKNLDGSSDAFKTAYDTAIQLFDEAVTLLNTANMSPAIETVLEKEATLKKYKAAAKLLEKKMTGCLNIMNEALS